MTPVHLVLRTELPGYVRDVALFIISHIKETK